MAARKAVALALAVAVAVAIAFYAAFSARPRVVEAGELVLPPELAWLRKLPSSLRVAVLAPDGEPLEPGSTAPREYTCDGAGREPVITWSPAVNATAYAVIVYDPDAPLGIFYHLAAYDLSGAGEAARYLPNSGGKPGWYPICPPPGHGTHRYYFVVVAYRGSLDSVNSLAELAERLREAATAWGWTYIVYSR